MHRNECQQAIGRFAAENREKAEKKGIPFRWCPELGERIAQTRDHSGRLRTSERIPDLDFAQQLVQWPVLWDEQDVLPSNTPVFKTDS